jgi:oligosaccharide repeat unit polymerase
VGCGFVAVVFALSGEFEADLVPATVLTALAFVIRLQQGSWVAPAAFFGLVWALLVWLALGFASDVPIGPASLWWIVLSVVALWIGTCLGVAMENRGAHGLRTEATGEIRRLRLPGLNKLIIILSLLGCGATLVLLQSRGEGLDSLLSLERLAALGRAFSIDRYSFGYTEPLAERALTVAIYCAAWAAGLALASPRSRWARWIALLPLIPASGIAAILTTRATVLFSIVLMAGSFLAGRVAISGVREPLFRAGRMLGIVLMGALLIPGFVLLQLARYGYSADNPGQVREVLTGFRLGFLSYAGDFSSWFGTAGPSSDGLHFGAYTFAGLFSFVGLQERVPGLYSNSVYVGNSEIRSNIYTIFRGLIEDFGLIGSLGFLVGVGLIAGLAFARLRKGNARYIPILAAFYACSFWSFVVDLFIYNTMLIAWLLFAGYVVLSQRQRVAKPIT